MPKKEESDFMRATEASMAKVRRIASTTNVVPAKEVSKSAPADVRVSFEGRRSLGNSGAGPVSTVAATNTTSTNVNKTKRESGANAPFALPPPAISAEEKDEWEEKVKAEMQAATEQVWQAAEAWVDAEAEVEELEWRILEMGIGRYVGLIDAPIDVDGTDGGKIEVKSAKKEKLLLDTAFNNVEDSTYWAVRHADKPSPEKRSTRYSTPQQSDEYSSPQQMGPGSGSKLHSKLSSPDRKRSLTPTEALRKIEARLSAAELNRDRSVSEKVQKAQLVSNRVKMRNEKEAERLLHAGEALHSKLHSATQRHSDYIAVIKGRAGNENAKVNEVVTANALNSEMVSHQLQQKLEEVEAKILAANLRREQRLAGIIGSQKKKNSKKALQMSEYRLTLEKVKMDRWEKLQRRIEAVQERRRVRIAEMKRRAEDEEQKKDDDTAFFAPSDSLDPIAEYSITLKHYAHELRRSGASVHSGGEVGGIRQSISLHSSPVRKTIIHDDESDLNSVVVEAEGLFISPEWIEIPLEMYSDFKTASGLAHKLLTESLMKAKIRQARKDTYAKALSCLWAAEGLYHHYYTADLIGNDDPLKAVMEHLIARRKCAVDGEEREASSFNMYSGLICEIGVDGLFEHPQSIEKINFVLASIVDQLDHTAGFIAPDVSSSASHGHVAASVDNGSLLTPVGSDTGLVVSEIEAGNNGNSSPVFVASVFQPVDDFVSSGGLLLLTVFLSFEFGLLSAGGVDSTWLIDSKWFEIESKVLLSKASSVDLQAILRLVRIAIERIDNSILLACCGLHQVLGEMALYISLIIYRGRCENITFRSSEHPSTQKLQEILGEVLTLWALVIEKMILMTKTSVTQTLQLFSLIVPGRVGSSLLLGSSATGSPAIPAASIGKSGVSSSVGAATSTADHVHSSENGDGGTLKRQLDDILVSYFHYTLLCQDIANFFTSVHVAVLSVQLSIEESFSSWKNNSVPTGEGRVLPKACNAAFLRMITGAVEYVTALTVFVRWSKEHPNVAYHTHAKHWWSLMRKANIMQFLYGSLILSTKQFFLSFYCHGGSLTVHDIDVLLHTSLALLKAIFALMMVDAEIFKQLSSSQKVSFLFHLHILLLVLTKLVDYGKEGITDKALQPTLGELTEDALHQSKQWTESTLQQLLFLLTLISERDVHARRLFGERHNLEEASKLEEHMRQVLLSTEVFSTSTTSSSSLFYALCHLPARYFKLSRTKHSLCTCIISACMELEQHVQMVKQAGRERYIQKFVEYMIREFDAVNLDQATVGGVSEAAAADNSTTIKDKDREEGDDDHRLQRQERIRRCLTLIPEDYWKTVIQLVWSKES
jgi:hypothetical protein